MDPFWTIFTFIIHLVIEVAFSPLQWVWNFWQRDKREYREAMALYPELARIDEVSVNTHEQSDSITKQESERNKETMDFLEKLGNGQVEVRGVLGDVTNLFDQEANAPTGNLGTM